MEDKFRENILLLISRHEQIEGEAIYRIGMPILNQDVTVEEAKELIKSLEKSFQIIENDKKARV